MRLRIVFPVLVLVIVVLAHTASARVWYCRSDAPPGDGSFAKPATNLTALSFAAQDGDKIIVMSGTYKHVRLDPLKTLTVVSQSGPHKTELHDFVLNVPMPSPLFPQPHRLVLEGFTFSPNRDGSHGVFKFNGNEQRDILDPTLILVVNNCVFNFDLEDSSVLAVDFAPMSLTFNKCTFNSSTAFFFFATGHAHFSSCKFINSHFEYEGDLISGDRDEILQYSFSTCEFIGGRVDVGEAGVWHFSSCSFDGLTMHDDDNDDDFDIDTNFASSPPERVIIQDSVFRNSDFFSGGTFLSCTFGNSTVRNQHMSMFINSTFDETQVFGDLRSTAYLLGSRYNYDGTGMHCVENTDSRRQRKKPSSVDVVQQLFRYRHLLPEQPNFEMFDDDDDDGGGIQVYTSVVVNEGTTPGFDCISYECTVYLDDTTRVSGQCGRSPCRYDDRGACKPF